MHRRRLGGKALAVENPNRYILINDIWHRLRCGREDLGNLQNTIIALIGQESADVAAYSLVNAFIVMQFIGFDAKCALADVQPSDSLCIVHYFELATRGILLVAMFACIYGN